MAKCHIGSAICGLVNPTLTGQHDAKSAFSILATHLKELLVSIDGDYLHPLEELQLKVTRSGSDLGSMAEYICRI